MEITANELLAKIGFLTLQADRLTEQITEKDKQIVDLTNEVNALKNRPIIPTDPWGDPLPIDDEPAYD